MVTTKLNLSMTEPSARQIYAKQGDTGRVLDITLDQTPEDGTLRILRPDGVEVTSEANLASDTYNVQTTPYYSGETTDLGMVMGTIEGKSEQDLNGQSAPYPAGGGKNKFDSSLLGDATASIKFITLTLEPNSAYTMSSNQPLGGQDGTAAGLFFLTSDESPSKNNNGVWNGQTRTKTTGADGALRVGYRLNGYTAEQLLSYTYQVELGSTATAYSPYSNICPITSFSTTEFVSDGKNLFDKADGAKNLYVGTGDKTGSGGTLLCFLVKKGTQYTISMTGGNRTNLFYYDTTSLDDIVSGITLNLVTLSATKPYTFIAEHDAVYCYYADTNFQQTVADSCMVELGSTATSYVPYQSPSTASVSLTLRSLPDGTCDTYENGVVTRRVGVHYITSSDSGSLLTGTYGSRVAITMPDMEAVSWPKWNNTICNIATPDTGTHTPTAWVVGQCLLYGSYGGNPVFFVIVDSAYANLSSALSYLESIGAYFYYPLATPTTETVTIPTLVTYENYTYVHNDSETDPTSIEYKAIMLEPGQVAIPSDATEIVGKCYCDIEQNGVSSMPFTLNVKKNERES